VRFLIDQSLPYRAAAELKSRGFEALHARDVNLSRTADDEILEWCRVNGYVAVTPDSDFPTIIVLTRATGPSVIRLDAQKLSAAQVASAVARAASLHADVLHRGALVTIRRHAVTVRELPIVPRSEEP
jgi:predicted nuclease of predicted toxin-antitoxin system